MITFVVSASKVNVMDSCWQLYDLHYNRRWAPLEKDKPLDNGSLVHLMLKHFYREKMKKRLYKEGEFGIVLDEATNMARRASIEMDLETKDIDEAIKVARENLLYHQFDGMEVHAVEEPFSKVLYETQDREVQGNKVHGVRLIYEGIVDLIATLPNQPLAGWDHKTESRRSNPSKLDNQFEGTAWAFNFETIIINKIGFQSSLKEEEKFRRVFLEYRNREILEEWRQDVIKTCMEAIERHRRALADKADWPRNRTSCNKFSGCAFRQVCAAEPARRAVKLQTWYRLRPVHELYEEDKIHTPTVMDGDSE